MSWLERIKGSNHCITICSRLKVILYASVKTEQCLHSTLKILLGSKVSLYKKLMVLDSDLLDQVNPVCNLFYYEWPQSFSREANFYQSGPSISDQLAKAAWQDVFSSGNGIGMS